MRRTICPQQAKVSIVLTQVAGPPRIRRPGRERHMSPRTTATVVLTGGFGRVGTILRPELGRRWKVHVVDRDEGRLGADEEFTKSDLHDGRDLDAALAQADALIHLAGLGNPRASWDEVFANVSTTDVVLRAAADHGIRGTCSPARSTPWASTTGQHISRVSRPASSAVLCVRRQQGRQRSPRPAVCRAGARRVGGRAATPGSPAGR